MTDFADYVVFVDESGDHSLTSIDPEFPVFALSFCVVSKADYIGTVVPAVQRLKFKYWGHDAVVLHEHEIRKTSGDFKFLRADRALRTGFMDDLTAMMAQAPITIFGTVINKAALKAKYISPNNPYEIAMLFCLERLHDFLMGRGQVGKHVHVIFECRGKDEDRQLELEFRRICDDNQQWGYQKRDFTKMRIEPVFVKKAANSAGLQLADLTARPMALSTLRPDQPNRAMDVIRTKLGRIKVFP